MSRSPGDTLRIYLERGHRRTFAVAVDWPGLARSARAGDEAVAVLLAYLPRYLPVARSMGLEPPPPEVRVDVVDEVEGTTTTDVGAPGVVPPLDDDWAWTPQRAERELGLLDACRRRLDEVAGQAPPTLRKGPRGGGRDTAAIVEHVAGAEVAFARKAGVRVSPPPRDRAGQDALRAAFDEALRHGDGRRPAPTGWPAAYAVRRVAWHALDHAWEIEDRSSTAG